MSAFAASSQVSQEPGLRNVLLEEFTAVNCGNCPAGHGTAAAIAAAYPEQTVVVNIHAGPLAVPSGSQPDFRTSWGTQLLAAHGVTFTPQGLINRRAYSGSTLLSSGAWSNAAGAVRVLPTPVNIAVTANAQGDASTIEVMVEIYYTASSASGDDRLHVLLTEDHITGWQTNYGAGGNQPAYDHRHVLRAYLTSLDGDPVASSGVGFTETRTFTTTVPAEWNITSLHVVAFVSEGPGGPPSGEVYQVEQAAVTMPTGLEEMDAVDAFMVFPNPADDRVDIRFAESSDGWLRVLDGVGREVLRERITPLQRGFMLSTASWPVGIYHVALDGGGSRRVMIQR
ncbi:MAG: Omp28-related outer membrane protein [Flavobacteriales bacterium]|nr:Omp28-related outer membrane protein [Flavobacteriales bacterium]